MFIQRSYTIPMNINFKAPGTLDAQDLARLKAKIDANENWAIGCWVDCPDARDATGMLIKEAVRPWEIEDQKILDARKARVKRSDANKGQTVVLVPSLTQRVMRLLRKVF